MSLWDIGIVFGLIFVAALVIGICLTILGDIWP